ncbi:2-polyprenyl-6-methoxyphenol hydroxylase-like FAD-dependent oxidoreductase [Mycolicibacterium iranicum]|uniref:2-polyprenyl-6-methoxyphenol hydroxylase-like FAD-dependent oxidoreductase n=1 Tax=Mycolicibacterium iranicum TaxID=912594 RepID=A0A839QC55_MYCIR|nr:NAD(P)/FAD-dependent oxidoreductase [Mycolicibacterium iranicum]MBB2993530.1 2-polyprenyl-6-methoxyphenol hydroxylase-like FAD-dependent oxidoreductase [Mycolicibacterium iranicum]
MFRRTSIAQQYEKASDCSLRVLVCGSGIAGLTVAQLLRRAGLHAVLIERATTVSAGYMLALLPMADPAIDGLGVRDEYRRRSTPITRYAVDGHTGRRLREDPIGTVVGTFGEYRGIDRGSLVEVLAGGGSDITMGAAVSTVTQRRDAVRVGVAGHGDGEELDFDVVIVAEGMNSHTRELLGHRVRRVDTGWGGWIAWADPDDEEDLGEELWGAGCFAATYPVAGKLGVFLGGPRTDTAAGPAAFFEAMRRRVTTPTDRIERAMAAVAAADDPYYWPLTDVRARDWTLGRTVLLGDAAAGFLPTAGIGAGMAMESAWVLSRALCGGDDIGTALDRFERSQRPRVAAAQRNSRQLARLMFRRSRLLASAREALLSSVSVERALGPIRTILATSP